MERDCWGERLRLESRIAQEGSQSEYSKQKQLPMQFSILRALTELLGLPLQELFEERELSTDTTFLLKQSTPRMPSLCLPVTGMLAVEMVAVAVAAAPHSGGIFFEKASSFLGRPVVIVFDGGSQVSQSVPFIMDVVQHVFQSTRRGQNWIRKIMEISPER